MHFEGSDTPTPWGSRYPNSSYSWSMITTELAAPRPLLAPMVRIGVGIGEQKGAVTGRLALISGGIGFRTTWRRIRVDLEGNRRILLDIIEQGQGHATLGLNTSYRFE